MSQTPDEWGLRWLFPKEAFFSKKKYGGKTMKNYLSIVTMNYVVGHTCRWRERLGASPQAAGKPFEYPAPVCAAQIPGFLFPLVHFLSSTLLQVGWK